MFLAQNLFSLFECLSMQLHCLLILAFRSKNHSQTVHIGICVGMFLTEDLSCPEKHIPNKTFRHICITKVEFDDCQSAKAVQGVWMIVSQAFLPKTQSLQNLCLCRFIFTLKT